MDQGAATVTGFVIISLAVVAVMAWLIWRLTR